MKERDIYHFCHIIISYLTHLSLISITMDLSLLKHDTTRVLTLFNDGVIGRDNIVYLEQNQEFIPDDWEWYKIPPSSNSWVNGQKNIIYLKRTAEGGNTEIWIPFRKMPKISFAMKFRSTSTSSKVRGVC